MARRMGAYAVSLARHVVAGLLAVAVCAAGPAACAEPVSPVVRVEEDWELVVTTPGTDNNGPQVTCVLSPCESTDATYSVFVLNHQSQPAYVAGGLQLQVWQGDVSVASHKFPKDDVMATPGETVRWTQAMQLNGNVLSFEISGGTSYTWGAFGGQGYLYASVTSDVSDLSGYSPAVSVANSGAGFAANRVESLVLKRVRYITAAGDVIEDNTERPVYTHD